MAAARWLGWEIHFSNEASKLGPRNPGFGEFGIVIKDGRIDVIAICSIVRKRRATAGISFFTIVLLALLYLHLAVPKYEVSLDLTPVGDASALPKGALMLSSLAGLNLGQFKGGQHFAVYVAALDSAAAAQKLIKDHEILHLMFPQRWDAKRNVWRHPPVSEVSIFFRAILAMPENNHAQPNVGDVINFLQRRVMTVTHPKSGIVTVSIVSSKPQDAAQILLAIVRTVDKLMRDRALTSANSHIKFLQKELRTTTTSDLRETLIDALSGQEKTKMMASSNSPYIAETLGAPQASGQPVSPRPLLTVVIAVLLGALLGTFAAIYADGVRKNLRNWKVRRIEPAE